MPSLYTIGYQGLSLEKFISMLQAHNVEEVVDVRELPLSRKPGFSKTKLSEALRDADIGYRSIRALGSPRDLRQEYRATQDWEDFSKRFLDHLKSQTDALQDLVDLAYADTICLMCYEHDSAVCHRRIVAEEAVKMADNGLRIKHL